MRPKAGICLAVFASLLVGCSTTLAPAKLNSAGRFDTSTLVAAGDVTQNAAFDKPKFGKLVFVKTDQKLNKLDEFFVTSIRNMGVFDRVATKEDLERLVIERHLEGRVSDVSGLIGLRNLQKEIGPFLVVEPSVTWNGGYNFEAAISATDPETAQTLLVIKKKAFNWAGLDKPLFYPLLNGLLDWTQGRPVATAPADSAPKSTH